MAKTNFQKTVDASKASLDQRAAETEREDLEFVLPVVGEIVAEAAPVMEKAQYVLNEFPHTLPLMGSLNQTVNVMSNILGKAFAQSTARLEELKGETPAEDPATEG